MVRGETRSHVPVWMERFDDAGQQRMRGLGREFLDLCLDYIEQPDKAENLETAAGLGSTYGKEIASRGIHLSDALQAFFFFRNATIEAINGFMSMQFNEIHQVHGLIGKVRAARIESFGDCDTHACARYCIDSSETEIDEITAKIIAMYNRCEPDSETRLKITRYFRRYPESILVKRVVTATAPTKEPDHCDTMQSI